MTLPAEIRKLLGVTCGDQVEFYEEDGKTMLRASGKDARSSRVRRAFAVQDERRARRAISDDA